MISTNPRAVDNTTRVSIWINGEEQLFVEEYSLDDDVLNLGDPFRVVVPNVDGASIGNYRVGDLCKIYMSSGDVDNTGQIQRYIGRLTTIDGTCSMQAGSTLALGGADLGWHLRECHAPIWHTMPGGITFNQLVQRLIGDKLLNDWKFAGVRFDNLINRKINQGRAGVERRIALADSGGRAYIQPFQVEPGQSAAEYLIDYARRAGYLVNVSSDGYIQFYKPNDTGAAEYTLRLYKSTNPDRNKGNVQSARMRRSIDGIYTETVCVGTVVLSNKFVQANIESPNRNRFRGQYTNVDTIGSLPFSRVFYFSDGDQYDKTMANKRAEWKWRRGKFDSFEAEYTVAGHVQGGKFWVPDTCVDLLDEIHGLNGKYYISAVRYNRTQQQGTTTTITVREAGQLSA